MYMVILFIYLFQNEENYVSKIYKTIQKIETDVTPNILYKNFTFWSLIEVFIWSQKSSVSRLKNYRLSNNESFLLKIDHIINSEGETQNSKPFTPKNSNNVFLVQMTKKV